MSDRFHNETFGSVTVGLNYDPTRVGHRLGYAVYIRPSTPTKTPWALDLADAKELHAHLGNLIDQIEAGIEAQKPKLPTAFGSVVEADGVKYVLDRNWYSDSADRRWFTPYDMAELDYTVLRDGV